MWEPYVFHCESLRINVAEKMEKKKSKDLTSPMYINSSTHKIASFYWCIFQIGFFIEYFMFASLIAHK